MLGDGKNIFEATQNPPNIPEDQENILAGSKKTSILLPPDLLKIIDLSPLNRTQTIVAALRSHYSGESTKDAEYKEKIAEYEKDISEYKTRVAVLEAQVGELTFLKGEFEKLHRHLDDQIAISKAHMVQMQQKEDKIHLLEAEQKKKEDQIFLLEEAKKTAEEEKKLLEEEKKKPKKKKWGIF